MRKITKNTSNYSFSSEIIFSFAMQIINTNLK